MKYLLGIVVLLFGNISILSAQEPPHWEYEGEAGPEYWGELDPSYELCGLGEAQSPIDIAGEQALNLVDIAFEYVPTALTISNNGHTIQVNYDAGSSITYNETRYDLLQFHFHHPSEHTVRGQPADMEIHFVHRDSAGNLAVVGVMLIAGDEDNANYAPIFDHLPHHHDETLIVDAHINAADLLPEARTYFTYTGSLTTPPCSQGVRWLLLTEPVSLSEAQIEAFSTIFELNARPAQALNDRDLLADNE